MDGSGRPGIPVPTHPDAGQAAVTGSPGKTSAGAGVPPSCPSIPDHELIRRIGGGSYGEVWLARNIMGTYRAAKLVFRNRFANDRPFEREFRGIQKFEPISRSHESQINILHVGKSVECFYYVMELADDAGGRGGADEAAKDGGRTGTDSTAASRGILDAATYTPRTLQSDRDRKGRLSFMECLDIGLGLTTALAHLHKHGLVHRDVKPSNVIFVNGIPKLADIGLVTDVDATASFVGTEGFIPPEGPGTPQADIYSLGKLLYEISAGKDRQEYPEPPTSLGELPEREDLLELNTVIHKACARNVRDRYPSAKAMHSDLLLLKTGRSVRRTHHLERRLAVMRRIAILAAAVMVFGAVPYYLAIQEARVARARAREEAAQRLRAEANQQKAQTEAVKSEQVARFLKSMLQGVGPSAALGRDTTLLREILEKTGERVDRDLVAQPAVAAELWNTMGEVWFAMGRYDRAEASHRLALEKRLKFFGAHNAESAESLDNLAKALMEEGKLAEAESGAREALATRVQLFGREHAEVAGSLGVLGGVLFKQGKRAESEAAYREALGMRRRWPGESELDLADALHNLAGVLYVQGKFVEAESTYREALALIKRGFGDEHPEVIKILNSLSIVLAEEGSAGQSNKFVEAESLQRNALLISRKLLSDDHPLVEQSLSGLGKLLRARGNLKGAEQLYREDLTLAGKTVGEDDPRLALKRVRLAGVLRVEGNSAEAEALEQRALAGARKLSDTDPSLAEDILVRLAGVLEAQGRGADAETLYREALTSARQGASADPPRLEDRLASPAQCLGRENKWGEAQVFYSEAMASARRYATNDLPRLEKRINQAADAFEANGKLAEAEPLFRETLVLKKKRVGDEARDVALLLRGLAYLLRLEGKLPESEVTYRESLAMAEKVVYQDHPEDVAWTSYGLAWVLNLEGKVAEAEGAARRALEVRRKLSLRSRNDGEMVDSLFELAHVLWGENKPEAAEVQLREGLELAQRKMPGDPRTFECCKLLGNILASERRFPDSERTLRAAVAIANAADQKANVAKSLYELGWILHMENKLADAETTAREALALYRNMSVDDLDLANSLYELAVVLKSEDKPQEAEPLARDCLKLYEKKAPGDWQTFNCRSTLGSILVSERKYTEAEPMLLSAYEKLSKPKGSTHGIDLDQRLRETTQRLVQIYEETQRSEPAAEWKRRLAELGN